MVLIDGDLLKKMLVTIKNEGKKSLFGIIVALLSRL